MTLSRIWAAFILVSIVVATVRYAFVPADKEIYAQMVTGKAGDTVKMASAPPMVAGGSASPAAGKAAPQYSIQKADGIIETCKYAVVLALGLIGIMALFMGLVSIAEEAGGIRFLARLTAPFFSKLFPDLP